MLNLRHSAFRKLFQSTTTTTTLNRGFSTHFAKRVLMVEPTNFFLNEETFQDNKFMNKVQIDQQEST
jgi:hypothetical protein